VLLLPIVDPISPVIVASTIVVVVVVSPVIVVVSALVVVSGLLWVAWVGVLPLVRRLSRQWLLFRRVLLLLRW
jgi:hypothetical protein